MSIVQELLRELGRELEQTVGEVEGVQQMLARMELEKMGLQVKRIGDNMDDEKGGSTDACEDGNRKDGAACVLRWMLCGR